MPVVVAAILVVFFTLAGDETVSRYAGTEAGFALETLDGQPPPGPLWIAFPREGAVEGIAPCSHFTATQPVPYPWIAFEDLSLTEPIACDAAAKAAQDRLLAALAAMTLVETLGDVLILTSEDGREMLFRGTGPAD